MHIELEVWLSIVSWFAPLIILGVVPSVLFEVADQRSNRPSSNLPWVLGLVESLQVALPSFLEAPMQLLRPIAKELSVGFDLIHKSPIVRVPVTGLHVKDDVNVASL